MNKEIKTKNLAIVLFFIGIFLALILFKPISAVFDGEYKLVQRVEIIENFELKFDKYNLVWLADILGMGSREPFGSIGIRYYSIFIVLGLLSGYFLSLFLASKNYIAGTVLDRLVVGLVIFGILGARLFFVLSRWDNFSARPITAATSIFEGGMAIFGSLIFTTAYLWIYCARFKFNFFEFLDFLTPGFLLGQIIGRFGNFFNYESYGPATSVYWKMFVPSSANFYTNDINLRYFHPTFLYEIIPNFLLLILILYKYDDITKKRSGLIFSFYAVGYGIIRFFTEFFRLDALKIKNPFLENGIKLFEIKFLGYIYISRLMAVLLIITGIYVYFKRSKILYLKKTMSEVDIS